MQKYLQAIAVLFIQVAAMGLGWGVLASPADLTVTSYADLVRFSAQGIIREFHVEILSLSGQKLFDSGTVNSSTLDWRVGNLNGRTVANGVYLYTITAKDMSGNVSRSVGKLTLLRGRGSAAPPLVTLPSVGRLATTQPSAFSDSGSLTFCCTGASEQLGVGASSVGAAYKMGIVGSGLSVRRNGGDGPFIAYESLSDNGYAPVKVDFYRSNLANSATPNNTNIAQFRFTGQTSTGAFYIGGSIVASGGVNSSTGFPLGWIFRTNPGDGSGEQDRMSILSNGNVGIGTTSPNAAAHVNNTTNQPALKIDASNGTNAIEVYNTGTGAATGLIYRVERTTGNVYADGSFNCGLTSGSCFNAGTGADVAERIDAIEPMEAGDVVEIHPAQAAKFRKSQSAISTRVAGIISTAPAVTLGNNFNGNNEDWTSDNRPLLALAGRVPVKVMAKYGAIKVGDLLVSSPIPGYAMKCPKASECIGAVIGKALEPLAEGVGKIEVQVMLR